MAIKVDIPYGQNVATVSGLYQWDYGQVLEIESADLGSIVAEVHFACSSMSEAIVRPCTFSAGIGTVTIPDECLEQSSNITAWIYEISGTQGRTRKTLTIHVTARTRPSVGHDIPTEISDKYTELITEVNEAIDALENGDVVAKKANEAVTASTATSAGNASTANYAVNAGNASTATNSERAASATYASTAKRSDGTDIKLSDCLISESSTSTLMLGTGTGIKPINGGIFSFDFKEHNFIMEIDGKDLTYSPVFSLAADGAYLTNDALCRLRFSGSSNGAFYVFLQKMNLSGNGIWEDIDTSWAIKYKRLGPANK